MERTMIFWIGLILLGLASVVLFGIFWMVAVVMHPASRIEFFKGLVPLIVGSIIFMLIGVSMMRQSSNSSRR